MIEIIMLIISCVWAVVTVYNFKLYRVNKKCTVETTGVLYYIEQAGGIKTSRLIGRLFFQTLNNECFNVEYKPGKFDRVPKHKGFFLPEELDVTVLYDPEMPDANHYIKGSYVGFQSIIIPTIICAIFSTLTVWTFLLQRL